MQSMCRKTAEDHGTELFKEIFHNIPRAMFVFLPLLALLMKLLYWRPKRYYVEHLLLLVHNHAFVFLAIAIMGVLTRIPVIGGHLGLLSFAVMLYVVWYIFRATARVLRTVAFPDAGKVLRDRVRLPVCRVLGIHSDGRVHSALTL